MKTNPGFTAKQLLLEQYDTEEKKYREITRLDKHELKEYEQLLQRFELVHVKSDQFATTDKGKALEDMVSFILSHSSVFEVHRNLRTSTNEIDQLLILNSKGRLFESKGLLRLFGDHLLSECKNYQGKIGVTWVGKLYSLLDTTRSKIGLLFSYHGLTGVNWNDATGSVKKLSLNREASE